MSHKQIQGCYERLSALDTVAAERFRSLMEQASAVAREVGRLRREAWAVYHEHVPRPDRDKP